MAATWCSAYRTTTTARTNSSATASTSTAGTCKPTPPTWSACRRTGARAGTATPSTPRSAPTGNAWRSPRRRPTSSARPSARSRTSTCATTPRHAGTTELVSRSSAGEAGDNISQQASISANGDAVAFYSAANNLDPSGPSTNDIFLHHLDADTTEAVLPSAQTYPEQQSQPVPNADGTVVAFVTRYDMLGTGASTDETRIYTIDLAGDTVRTAPAHDFEVETDPDISDDGRYVAYRTDAAEGRRNRRCLRVGPRGRDHRGRDHRGRVGG